MLRTRVLTAAVLAPAVLLVVLLGEPWMTLMVALVIFLALIEMVALLDAGGFEPPQVLTLGLGLAVAAAGLITVNQGIVGGLLSDLLRITAVPGLVVLVFTATVLLLAAASLTRAEPRAGFLSWATSSFGVAYVALLAPFIVLVAHLAPAGASASTAVGGLGLRSGAAWAFMLVLVVWGYDTGAYFTGRQLGRRRLIDHVSPSKTIEGLVGGLVTATAAAALGTWLIGLPAWHALVIGPLVGLAAQAGDLAESLLKRAAGRKESGFIIPGHGGMLDRIDSFLFAAPVLVGYALAVAGASV
ncbi:MAG TPA: phosphatidate cytidylyltransferase [Candidatus Limnocylindria bacterium]